MTDDIVIKVESLSKCYHIYEQPSHRLLQMICRGHKQFYREFWALKDVSFELKSGETVGIIGRNGSGKSTLLQMLCGTLNPTSGSIEAKGRIAALLELGSGFNPEFTGRENIFMNASILGLSKVQTAAKFEEIVAFSEIGEFIDEPVRSYSSGMVMRLAFAVAIQIDPDILVVDEALSVGDERFQRKCFSRLETLRARGSTILFVSHSAAQIVQLCDRALLLEGGQLLEDGQSKRVVGHYLKLIYAPEDKRTAIRREILKGNEVCDVLENYDVNLTDLSPANQAISTDQYDPDLKPTSTVEYASHGAYIRDPGIYTLSGEPVNNLITDKYYIYRYNVDFTVDATGVSFGMLIKSMAGVELGGASTRENDKIGITAMANTCASIEFNFQCRLNPGTYFLNAGVMGMVHDAEVYLHRLTDAAMFRVVQQAKVQESGMVSFSCEPTIMFNDIG